MFMRDGLLFLVSVILAFSIYYKCNESTMAPLGESGTMKLSAVVLGATGATGRQVVRKLLSSDRWESVSVIVRRSRPELWFDGSERPSKLNEIIVEDQIEGLASTENKWAGATTMFNCIGTTRKAAGGAAGFKMIEVGITTAAAAVAKKNGVTHVSVVSAQGASNTYVDPWELVHPLLYARTLWQKEQAILKEGFERVTIFRPGMLNRLTGDRWHENVINWLGAGLRVDQLAGAMVRDAERPPTVSPVHTVVGNGAISKLATSSD